MAVAYRKGFKKTLLAIGIPNLLFGATLISSGYTQPAIYALVCDICFMLEKLTPLITYKFASEQELVNEYISFIAGIVLDIGFALATLILFIRLRKKARRRKRAKRHYNNGIRPVRGGDRLDFYVHGHGGVLQEL